MTGETDLTKMLENMHPKLNAGEFVFITLKYPSQVEREDTLFEFKEKEGVTVILERKKADELGLSYEFVASWITLQVHSSLEAVGLTAAFSTALADNNISCNVVAAYYHDHIFVAKTDETNALNVLLNLSGK